MLFHIHHAGQKLKGMSVYWTVFSSEERKTILIGPGQRAGQVSHISDAKSPSSMGKKSIPLPSSPPVFSLPLAPPPVLPHTLYHPLTHTHTSTELVDTRADILSSGRGLNESLISRRGDVSPCNHGVESPSATSSPNADWWSVCVCVHGGVWVYTLNTFWFSCAQEQYFSLEADSIH